MYQRGHQDPIAVANFLDHVGIADENANNVDAALRNPNYRNMMTMQ